MIFFIFFYFFLSTHLKINDIYFISSFFLRHQKKIIIHLCFKQLQALFLLTT